MEFTTAITGSGVNIMQEVELVVQDPSPGGCRRRW
jgi:hypothetical protein